MPAPDFLEAYLSRRRQLEQDRTVKEQFDREMAWREQAQQQQAQMQMEGLAQQQREQRQHAQEFAETLAQRKAELEAGRGMDVMRMAAAGEIRDPQTAEIPMTPDASQDPLKKLGLPTGQGTVSEIPTSWGGKSFVFTSPSERKRADLEVSKDLELQYDEEARNRRIAAFKESYDAGDISESQYSSGIVALRSGINPGKEDAEAVYIAAKNTLSKDPTNRRAIYMADSAMKWLKETRAGMGMPYGAMNNAAVMESGADLLRRAASMEGPRADLSVILQRAKREALTSGNRLAVQWVDQMGAMLNDPNKKQNFLDEFMKIVEDLPKFQEKMKALRESQGAGNQNKKTPPPSPPPPQGVPASKQPAPAARPRFLPNPRNQNNQTSGSLKSAPLKYEHVKAYAAANKLSLEKAAKALVEEGYTIPDDVYAQMFFEPPSTVQVPPSMFRITTP